MQKGETILFINMLAQDYIENQVWLILDCTEPVKFIPAVGGDDLTNGTCLSANNQTVGARPRASIFYAI
jgi:hypothetical protein